MGRAALILVLGFTAIHHIAAFNIQRSVLAVEEQVMEHYGEMLALNRRFGVKILGGCCGTGVDHLRYLAAGL